MNEVTYQSPQINFAASSTFAGQNMKRFIRNLIIGKNAYIESINEYRQVMLSGQYGLIALFVLGFYIFMDLREWRVITESSIV